MADDASPPRVVLCGTDFTAPAQAAADLAARLAGALGAGLRLVHVEPRPPLPIDHTPAGAQLHDLAALALEAEAARLRARHAVPIAAELRRGSPGADLARAADEVGATLIAVAAIGPTPSIFRIGGSAERVAQAARVPVLLVRDPAPLAAWLDGDPLAVAAMLADDAASDRAIEWLRALRRIGACDVTALHAYYVDEAMRRYGLTGRSLVDADPEVEGYLRRDLERRVGPLGGRGAIAFEAIVATGRRADHLLAHPAARGAGLVVVGNHRARGLARLSSVAAGVVHLAPASVLVVPVDAPAVADAPWPRLRRVVVATDFSAFAQAAVRHAYGLVAADGGEVILLHVRDDDGDEEEALARLRALAPARPPRGVTTSCAVERRRDVATGIEEAASRRGADAIVIASHGRTGLRRAVLGSVAQAVVQAAARPVLVVRPPDDVGP